MRPKHLLENKGSAIHAIAPDASVLDAIKLMAEKHVGALLVMRGATLVGIVSERDYARKVVLMGRSSRDTAVLDIMSAPVITVNPQATVPECMQTVTEHRVRHLPVVDGERVIGVLSIGDLVKSVIDEQQQHIDQLQRYIAGEAWWWRARPQCLDSANSP
ncbi:CBS domain-containing protein [Pseudolysobacter antarcticus]|uniref:CBS domain-containing protein n=1 Tax=Pseudolysobacter antarcticus TaxID=2511995 RepID=A0A411HQN7_9GAMM|nr:CBS domain-containing protein [Pseudolysobacter antarcticus]QBB72740.1 CBS domain-containing protein [Pseudolysobacter antarcticus]